MFRDRICLQVLLIAATAFACEAFWAEARAQELSAEEKAIVAEFEAEAPKAWDRYIEAVKKLRFEVERRQSGELTTYGRAKYPDSKDSVTEWVFGYDSGNCYYEETEDGKRKEAGGYNDYYYFLLWNDGEKWFDPIVEEWKNGNPLLNRIDAYKYSDIHLHDLHVLNCFLESAVRGLYISTAYFPILIRQQEFKYVGAESTGEGEARRVRIRFTTTPTDDCPWSIVSGDLVFAPSRYWTIESGEYGMGYEGSPTVIAQIRYEYEDLQTGWGKTTPFCTRQTSVHVDNTPERNETSKKEDVVEITLLTKPIERERFRLTHYGFAEPEDVELPSNFSSRWILLAVGAALIVGAIVAMRRRKGTASLD
ncbi:MAG: hypothetical protein IJU03_06355 [Thermoguttaceae bacterium]|nr:hypothetical protein [Thermoguttaceae bacterium]